MEIETFKMRKQFLEEFYNEDRIRFLNAIKNIYIRKDHSTNSIDNRLFILKTKSVFNLPFVNMFKIFCKFLKPFTYFLYSITYYENFLQDKFLFFSRLEIKYGKQIFNMDELLNKTVYFDISYADAIPDIDHEDYEFLKSIKIEDVLNESIEELLYLEMKIITKYININRSDYIYLGGIVNNIRNDDMNYIINEEKKINSSQSFKSEECVICLTNPPNVLFCNCGHLCLCSECEKLKNSNKCPICKIENRIIRVL